MSPHVDSDRPADSGDSSSRSGPGIGAGKAALRSEIRASRRARRRRDGSDTARAGEAENIARAVVDHLDACPAALAAGWGRADAVVAAFRSTPSEPDTSALLAALADRGATILVPRTRDDLTLDWHELRTVRSTSASPGSSASGADDAAELPSTDDADDEGPALGLDAISDITAMILPGIAIDRHGHRLGQGGGCYDRTLPRMRPDTCRAVLLFEDEIRDTVPSEPHDQRLPAVVTPEGGWRDLRVDDDAS